MNKKSVLLAVAVAGLVAGAQVAKSPLAFADHEAGKKEEGKKHGCDGPNGCGHADKSGNTGEVKAPPAKGAKKKAAEKSAEKPAEAKPADAH